MNPTRTNSRIRIAILTAFGALVSMGADCETVGTAQDRCLPAPDGYNLDLGLDLGEECYYAVDCNSGVCMPDGGDAAVCSPWGAHETTYCEAELGSGYVAMVLPSCHDPSWTLTPTCIPANTEAESCGSHECCDFQEVCTQNDDCCSGWCYDEESDGQGRCAESTNGTCSSGDAGWLGFVDPVVLCLP